MSDFNKLTGLVCAFRDARNWKQFHKPKDMALSLLLEASELAEHFQWKSDEESLDILKSKREDLADELSDVLYWTLLMAHDFGINLPEAFEAKLEKNERKYPVEKSKNNAKKYSELA